MAIFLLDDMEVRRNALRRKRPAEIVRWSETFKGAVEGAEWWHMASTIGGITEVWLDHDLTERHYHGDYSDSGTGLEFVRLMIERRWFEGVPIYVHTMNAARGDQMVDELRAAGYEVRREFLIYDPSVEGSDGRHLE